MKTRLLLLILFLAIGLTSFSQTKVHFPNLNRVSVDETYHAVFAFDPVCTRVINLPCYALDKKDPLYRARVSTLATWQLVAKYKNKDLKDSLAVLYCKGNSSDPTYEVTNSTGQLIRRFPCVDFYINDSGTIYTSGHYDKMYARKRKFHIQNDSIVEINQPYSYVGIKGKTKKAITLYRDQVGNETVAQVPKDYELEILLAEGSTQDYELEHNYLVRTEFGLVGWLRLSNEDLYGGVMKEFYYAGD